MVDGKTLNDITNRCDKVIGSACWDNRRNNCAYIIRLVLVGRTFVQKFLNDIRKFDRERFAHFRPCVFAWNISAYSDQTMNGNMIPIFYIAFCFLHKLNLSLRIINECAKVSLFRLAQRIAKKVVHLSLNVSRRILQDVLECFVFAVNICQEVLCALWQIQYSLQVYDFRTCICNCWKRLRQQLQIAFVFL